MGFMSFSRRAATATATLAAVALTAGLLGCSSGGGDPATGASTGGAAATAGASAGGGSAAIVPGASKLSWHACGGQLAGLQCTTLQVPLNYAGPGGRKITIALSMLPATAPKSQQQGVLLVNPGGPGEPGRSLAGDVAAGLSPQVAADYDIVGFDPRGVGASVPALTCDPSFYSGLRPDYIPANAAAEQVLITRAKTYAADCEQRFGWLLPYLTTVNMARDMDEIRQAFGVQKINYYAFSYGTYLGQAYATLFPSRVRRMVLDSTVDPAGAWYADNISQDYAFQGRLEAFFAWIAKYDSTYQLGSTAAQVQSAYYQARERLQANPVAGPSGLMLGADDLDDTFLLAGVPEHGLAGLRHGPRELREQRLERRPGQPVPGVGRAERQRVRHVQRGRMRGRQLAAELGEVAVRHPAGIQDRALPGVGQRLVQRGVRVLAGQGPGPAAADQGCRAAPHPDAPGDAGRGHAVRRRAERS